jgi:hypothetical protein
LTYQPSINLNWGCGLNQTIRREEVQNLDPPNSPVGLPISWHFFVAHFDRSVNCLVKPSFKYYAWLNPDKPWLKPIKP